MVLGYYKALSEKGVSRLTESKNDFFLNDFLIFNIFLNFNHFILLFFSFSLFSLFF